MDRGCDFPLIISLLLHPTPNHPRYRDLINRMTYDLRGSWEGFIRVNSPRFAGPNDQGDYKFFNVVSDEMDSGQPVLLDIFGAFHGIFGQGPEGMQGCLMDRMKMTIFPSLARVPYFPVPVTNCTHLSFTPKKAEYWFGG